MIGEYTLKVLCDKYGLDSNKLITKNNNILNKGEFIEIDKTLNYLINELKINPANIEKCPSILYRNVSAIKSNIIFLKNSKINFSDIETCLHVLSTEPQQLEMTYKYVKDNYNEEPINKITSILRVPKEIIIEVEKLNIPFKSKIGNLSVAVGVEFRKTTLEDIQKIIQSEEFKTYPHLFTSETLAHAKLEDIQKIIQSEEFKTYPHLFTSTTLAHANLEDIRKVIQSEEFKTYPHLFTSQTLARANLENIRKLLKLPYWSDDRFKNLLTSTIIVYSKKMLTKLPVLIELAERYDIDKYLNTSFLIFSPSQNYAIINYLLDNNQPLVVDGKLNSIFGKQPGLLKKKYGIDIKELIEKYQIVEELGGKKRK